MPEAADSIQALRQGGVSEEASWRLFQLSRRNGDYEAARAALETMIARRQRGDAPYEELSKLYEHHLGNCGRALEYARKALELCADETRRDAHARRVARLRLKLDRQARESEKAGKWPL